MSSTRSSQYLKASHRRVVVGKNAVDPIYLRATSEAAICSSKACRLRAKAKDSVWEAERKTSEKPETGK